MKAFAILIMDVLIFIVIGSVTVYATLLLGAILFGFLGGLGLDYTNNIIALCSLAYAVCMLFAAVRQSFRWTHAIRQHYLKAAQNPVT